MSWQWLIFERSRLSSCRRQNEHECSVPMCKGEVHRQAMLDVKQTLTVCLPHIRWEAWVFEIVMR